jgi:pyruvate/2-oxoglutarate dehydrogenase complex dihydrolipoamide dehydrogenase (E3) component
LTAPRIFINVGGRALVPEMPGIGEVPFLTNTSILALDRVPAHLIVVGGSYVGLEFAQMYRRFGAEVTVVEKGPRLIGREDDDVSDEVRGILEREGIGVHTGAECIALARHEQGVAVSVDCTHGPPLYVGSHVLLAVGRRPNTDDLGLDRAGVATDARGYIAVNEDLSTSVSGIWAIGDCNGRGAFTHTAYNDFEIVAANLLDGEHREVRDRVPAYALYVDPPLGRVGMTDREALASGRKLLVGGDEEDPRGGDPRHWRRRSHSRPARHHQRRRDIRRAAASRADSSDGIRVDPDTAFRDEASRVSTNA